MSNKDNIIKNLKEKSKKENLLAATQDQAHWNYYLSKKIEMFDLFLEKFCKYDTGNDQIEIIGYNKISLDSFDPAGVLWWDYLFKRIPIGSFEIQSKIRKDFISYAKENGVTILGFFYPKYGSF